MKKRANRGGTPRKCSCGKPGTVAMVDPEYPQGKNSSLRYYFCLDCSLLCRYLVPDDQVQTDRQREAEHSAASTSRAWEGDLYPARHKGIDR